LTTNSQSGRICTIFDVEKPIVVPVGEYSTIRCSMITHMCLQIYTHPSVGKFIQFLGGFVWNRIIHECTKKMIGGTICTRNHQDHTNLDSSKALVLDAQKILLAQTLGEIKWQITSR